MKRQKQWYKYMLLFLFFHLQYGCSQALPEGNVDELISQEDKAKIILGNERMNQYLPLLNGKKVAVVGNHTSIIQGGTHLVDSLLSLGVKLVKVFSPEHGFRGDADAGEKVRDKVDPTTSLPIISLYGDNKKPLASQLADVEVLLFDIQDVGVRFYTYISTLHYVMEAAAENGKKVIVLDRPNPNGHYVDGPVLEKSKRSFVGLHPVPIVHGMTIGEYAQMINGEGWLKSGVKADLRVIKCENYNHQKIYELPIAPSPNLPNMRSIYLYPSICLFEGTVISVGRGTDKPFQQIGHPSLTAYTHSFTPKPNFGAKSPKLLNKECFGIDLSELDLDSLRDAKQLNITFLREFLSSYPDQSKYFNNFFDLLAGNDWLKQLLSESSSEEVIRQSWDRGLMKYKEVRKNYLIYED